MNVQIVPLEPRHAGIVPRLREADVEEIRAMTGMEPKIPLAFSIANADPGWAAEADGRVEAVFGVGPVANAHCPTGRPWLVGTDEVAKHPVMFYRLSRGIVDAMKARYDQLINWVDARNELSIRWLKWLGFHIEDPEPMGVEGLPFHCFWWKTNEVS